jgi:cardiolipin synthase
VSGAAGDNPDAAQIILFHMLGYIPNLLTVLRLALVPVFIVLINAQDYGGALLIFLVAGITDGADGYIAKRYNCETRVGALLDPLADKCLLISAYGMLTYFDAIPFWLTVTVIFRDILIIGGYVIVLAMYETSKTPPTMTSKINTVMQIILIVAVMLELADVLPTQPLQGPLAFAVLATTVVSGLQYLWIWGFDRSENGPDYE